MNFPKYLSDEDMELFLKELRLSGVFYSAWRGMYMPYEEIWIDGGNKKGYVKRSSGGWVFLADCQCRSAHGALEAADAYRIEDSELP